MKNSDVISIRGNDLEAEASLWIVKMDRGLSAEENGDLRKWLSLSAKHHRYFLHYAEVWGKTEVLSSLADLLPLERAEPSRNVRRWLWGAGLGLVTGSLMVFLMLPFDLVPSDRLNPPLLSYQTAVGGMSRVVLNDGSMLTLNTNTQLDVIMGPQLRHLFLNSGEIHLNVAKDPSRPFQVYVGDIIFEAVGTQFNIKIDKTQHVELLVTEGLVRVGIAPKEALSLKSMADKKSPDLLLGPGGKVTIEGLQRVVETLPDRDIEVELSWQKGNLIFRGEPLSEAIVEISRYTSVEFVIVDDDLKTIQVAGLFKSGDISGFLAALEANFDIQYERLGNQTYLTTSQK